MKSRARLVVLVSSVGAVATGLGCADDTTLPSHAPRGAGGAQGSAGGTSSGGKAQVGGSPSMTTDCPSDAMTGVKEITVSAGTETRTGIRVAKGQWMLLLASGKWCWGVGSSECSTADGTPGRPTSSELPVAVSGATFGTLSARLGNGPPRAIGSSYEGELDGCGELVLFMNDRPNYYDDNAGSLNVVVKFDATK